MTASTAPGFLENSIASPGIADAGFDSNYL